MVGIFWWIYEEFGHCATLDSDDLVAVGASLEIEDVVSSAHKTADFIPDQEEVEGGRGTKISFEEEIFQRLDDRDFMGEGSIWDERVAGFAKCKSLNERPES